MLGDMLGALSPWSACCFLGFLCGPAALLVPVIPGLKFGKTSEFGRIDQTADNSLAKGRVVSEAEEVLPAEGFSAVRWQWLSGDPETPGSSKCTVNVRVQLAWSFQGSPMGRVDCRETVGLPDRLTIHTSSL